MTEIKATTKKKATTKTKKTAKRKKTLLIVESPSKAKIIGKYLGSSYKVIASVGHVRDLPKSRLGIDIDNNFEPGYINIRGKGDKIKELKKEAKAASKIMLATDPDREGEAISWHLAYILGIEPDSDCRIEFNEINKNAVKEAIKKPRPIDIGLVDAQQARRILDRLVGYQISPLLWKKVRRGLSAGRVQSAALKIICDREREIQNFIPSEYWNIFADFGGKFIARLSKKNNKKIEVTSKAEADTIISELNSGAFTVENIKKSQRKVRAYAPFTTSSLQQDSANKLGFSTKKTMQIAQQLYEGVEIKGIGARGLVTYIRTDSVRISDEAKGMAKDYIEENYGSEYTASNSYSNKKKDIQDAHEAIRPSDIILTAPDIKDSLSKDQFKLYKLIWDRFIASQMSNAVYDTVSVDINNGAYLFKASGSKLVFDGYKKVYSTSKEEDSSENIPELEEGKEIKAEDISGEQKFTQPPQRYTEASLVKEMEEKNIGRPSTYAAIIATLTGRRYVKKEKKSMYPTELGFSVINILEEYFTDIVNTQFTSDMEDNLDKVELKRMEWQTVIDEFYKGFSKELKKADAEVERIEQEVRLSDELCEVCGKPLEIKEGRFGEFLACTGYPECTNTKPIIKKIGVKCPECGNDLIEKKSRRGRIFYGCSNYPDCTVSYWDKPTNQKCPKCGSLLLEKNGKEKRLVCSNKECDYKVKADEQ